MKAAVFCDFDGTISERDIGYSLFTHFSRGENLKFLPDWKSGVMSTRECLRREAELVHATAEELATFLQQFRLRDGFAEFHATLRSQGVPLVVLSDGLDLYINAVLGRFGFDDLTIRANHGDLIGNRLQVSFPHTNVACTRCGSCKGEYIDAFRNRHESLLTTIFVGDGYSDTCGAKAADVVFARKDLKDFCEVSNIQYYDYESFFDVTGKLRSLNLLD